ncbi:hypothetical protein ACQP10_12530 [Streptosporangium sandarakinum]
MACSAATAAAAAGRDPAQAATTAPAPHTAITPPTILRHTPGREHRDDRG